MRLPRQFPMLAAVWFAGCAKVVVVKVDTPQVPAAGVIYALPKTVVRVLLKVDRVELAAAPFGVYAPIFAPDGKPVCRPKEDTSDPKESKLPKCTGKGEATFAVQPAATFATYGEPDPDNVFLVKFTNGGVIDQTLSMTWNEAGLLTAASAAVTNRTIDIAVSGLKMAAGLGTKAAGVGAPAVKAGVKGCADIDSSFQSDDVDSWFLPILQSNQAAAGAVYSYCALPSDERSAMPHKEENRALFQSATGAYVNRLAKLLSGREGILGAVNGQISEAAALLPRIETEIARREAALYLGSKTTTTWDGALDIRSLPEGPHPTFTPIPVLRLADDGVCLISGAVPPDGKPIPPDFSSKSDCPKGLTVNLALDFYPAPNRQLFSRLVDNTTRDRSFRYRLPAQVKASLNDDATGKDHKVYGAGFFSVAQLGTVLSLPAQRRSKSLTYDLGFIEATGALKTFKLGTTGGLDSSTIDALAGIGGTALDARNKARPE